MLVKKECHIYIYIYIHVYKKSKENRSGRNHKTYLLKQKYPEQLIDNGIYKAKEHERSDLPLTRGHERNSNIIPFVHTHNPRNQNVIINQLNTILKEDQAKRGIFENVRFITSKQQPRNLKGLICNSKFKETHSVRPFFYSERQYVM